MSHLNQTRRTGEVANLVATILPALFLSSAREAAAQTITEHPYMAPVDIKSEACLGCHPDKKEGRFVHTALKAGYEPCHRTTSDKAVERTKVTLVARGGALCAMCHAPKKDPVIHGPYRAGECIVCHSPHASDFPGQTRAAANPLCLSCHGTERPDVNVRAGGKGVSVLGGRALDFSSYQKAPKISVEHAEQILARGFQQPQRGAELSRAGLDLNCLSCHQPHSSRATHLLKEAKNDRVAPDDLGAAIRYVRTHFIGGGQ